jgi:hypothetical protein
MQKFSSFRGMTYGGLVLTAVAVALVGVAMAGPQPRGDEPPGRGEPSRPPLPCGKVCGVEVVSASEQGDTWGLAVIAECPPDKVPIGGGAALFGTTTFVRLIASQPAVDESDETGATLLGWHASGLRDLGRTRGRAIPTPRRPALSSRAIPVQSAASFSSRKTTGGTR